LALRAAGAGFRVFIAQFVKGMKYSELNAVIRFSDLITLRQYGRGCFINGQPTEDDSSLASSRSEGSLSPTRHLPVTMLFRISFLTSSELENRLTT
jgi:ATP:corrinoid adenosyltransferase